MACNIISERILAEYLGLTSSNVLVGLAAIFAERACDAYVGFPLHQTTATEFYPAFNHFEADQFVDVDPVQYLRATERLRLLRRPVKAVDIAVYEDVGAFMGQRSGSFDSSTLLTLGTHYVLDLDVPGCSKSGNLIRLGGSWPQQEGSIKVTYTAGFSSTELDGSMTGANDYYNATDVRQAVLMAAMKNYNELKKQQPSILSGVGGPATYEKIEGYEYEIDKGQSESLWGMTRELPMMSKKLLSRYINYGSRLVA